ncbi:MAG: transglutaminase family protein, partial [Pseudomonadota bacterium]
PFLYGADLDKDLTPYFEVHKSYGPAFEGFLKALPKKHESTIDWLVEINQAVWKAVGYTIRMEPGVQTPEQTLDIATGSCRDSAWLLVHLMRRMGVAARFVSGYLLQLTPDIKAVDGPSGPAADFTDLHAWCEVYAPGAGWVGLDPTSGLFAAEGHIPLAATPAPASAAPITGGHEPAEVAFSHHMEIRRVREEPRITLPFTDEEWALIDAAGHAVDGHLAGNDVRLTMGGEPTFVSASDRDADEWNTGAVGPTKRHYADRLMRRLREAFAPSGVLHYGQGKWYPGEQLPRWAFGLYWRADDYPLWQNPELIAPEAPQGATIDDAQRFADALVEALELPEGTAMPAYEDPAFYLFQEGRLPENLNAAENNLEDPLERRQLAQAFDRGLSEPTSVVLPCQLAQGRAATTGGSRRVYRWSTETWRTRRGQLFLAPGDASAGYRLPLASLPYLAEGDYPFLHSMDPFADRTPIAPPPSYRYQSPGATPGARPTAPLPAPSGQITTAMVTGAGTGMGAGTGADFDPMRAVFVDAVRTAISVEPRGGTLTVFLPPVPMADAYVDLVAAVEEAAHVTGLKVHLDGYAPPHDQRLNV